MRSLVLAAVLFAQQPQEGFVPPVLKGIKGDGGQEIGSKPIPLPSPDRRWVRARTRHFEILSDAGERRTRDLARHLEDFAVALSQLHPRMVPKTVSRTRVIGFGKRSEGLPYFNALLNRTNAPTLGVFVTQADGASMIIDMTATARVERTSRHELVHYVLAGDSDVRPPLWLEEGLAEYYSVSRIVGDEIWSGRPVLQHLRILRSRRGLIPFEQILQAKPGSAVVDRDTFYAQCWAAVDWLMRTKRSAFYDFLLEVEAGGDVDRALRRHYSRTLPDLIRAVAMYSTGYQWPPFATKVKVDVPDATIEVAAIQRADALAELGRFLSGFEGLAPEAERHFKAALAEQPKHGRSLAGIGWLLADQQRWPEAESFFARAVAADRNDPELYLEYAEALLRNEIGPLAESMPLEADAPDRFRRARELAQRALDVAADPAKLGRDFQGRAHGAIGTSYIVESDFAAGIAELEKANDLLPRRADYALHLLSLHRRSRDLVKAEALFAKLEARASAQTTFAARAIVVREELSLANSLVQAQKLPEAIAVLLDLAKNTPDEGARADLERQAADLQKVADANNEIRMYNRAISEANTGDKATAIRTLDELLGVAKDAVVIRDAKKLRAELVQR